MAQAKRPYEYDKIYEHDLKYKHDMTYDYDMTYEHDMTSDYVMTYMQIIVSYVKNSCIAQARFHLVFCAHMYFLNVL